MGHRKPLLTWRLKRGVTYVEAHIADRMTLQDLSQAAGISRMHFAAQFKALMGVTPHRYVLARRVEFSQTLLYPRKHTIAEIAHAAGFSNQSHYTTVFRKFVGETPSRWRSGMRGGTQKALADRNL